MRICVAGPVVLGLGSAVNALEFAVSRNDEFCIKKKEGFCI